MKNKIKRNELDFILTDILPEELSINFSYKDFYDFLMEKDNFKRINDLSDGLKKQKANNNKMFSTGWVTAPMKYLIKKDNNSFREMSIIHPFSVINIYYFITIYQKEIINYFESGNKFSIRSYKNNTSLYFLSNKKMSNYQITSYSKKKELNHRNINNKYFKITPHTSIISFHQSKRNTLNNLYYSHYAKLDYKGCFDSIYSHSYKWIISDEVKESKKMCNSSLLLTIDRLLQNINSFKSNGILIGPEFSRMITEILLQHIDQVVYLELKKININIKKDYKIYRFVDDFLVYANDEKNINLIIECITKVSKQFNLELNELKTEIGTTPILKNKYVVVTRQVSNDISNLFNKKRFYDTNDNFIIKEDKIYLENIKENIFYLIKKYPQKKKFIINYLISTIYNSIINKNSDCTLFKKVKINKKSKILKKCMKLDSYAIINAYEILDLTFFMYSIFPNFQNTRKIISIITLVNLEVDLKNKNNEKLQNIINDYDFIFKNKNLNDLIDWFPFLREYNVFLKKDIENYLFDTIINSNDPLLLANFFMYTNNMVDLRDKTKEYIETKLTEINNVLIIDSFNNRMISEDIWYLLIFYNCPYLSHDIIKKLKEIFEIIPSNNNLYNQDTYYIIYKYICDDTSKRKGFFNWRGNEDIAENITYSTYYKTIFSKIKKRKEVDAESSIDL